MEPIDSVFWTDLLICSAWLQLRCFLLSHSGPALGAAYELSWPLFNIFGALEPIAGIHPSARILLFSTNESLREPAPLI